MNISRRKLLTFLTLGSAGLAVAACNRLMNAGDELMAPGPQPRKRSALPPGDYIAEVAKAGEMKDFTLTLPGGKHVLHVKPKHIRYTS